MLLVLEKMAPPTEATRNMNNSDEMTPPASGTPLTYSVAETCPPVVVLPALSPT